MKVDRAAATKSQRAAQQQVASAQSRPARLRKAKPLPNDWAAGNSAKYLSYREAWARIRMASKRGYFLEAVTIEESIISDRLLSYLEKTCDLALADGAKRVLKTIVDRWIREATARCATDEQAKLVKDLHSRLNAWRDQRNRVVHGMVKSTARKGEDHIESFLAGAADAAREGQEIARAISDWVFKAGKCSRLK